MKTKRYGYQVLQLVKKKLPKLYDKHIKGRQAKFIDEHIPIGEDVCNGVKVGCIPKDLRLLWALSCLFQQTLKARKVIRTSEACQVIYDGALSCIGMVCDVMFWMLISHSLGLFYKNKEKARFSFVIQPDWSVMKVSFENLSSGQKNTVKQTICDALVHLIGCQMEISEMAIYAKSRVEEERKCQPI